MRNARSILFLIVAFLCNAGFAQTINKAKLDSLFSGLVANNKAMGSIAISKNGKLLYSKTFGYSLYSNEKKILSTENSKYRIGSISKIYTAIIIFQLIEEGKISLTTTLDNYFPQFPNSGSITISNLLNHRSGIRNVNAIASKETPRTQQEMLRLIAEKKPNYKAGEKTSYSNSNYLLLGYIIEKICGRSYADVLQERIVSVIKLSNTYYGNKVSNNQNECYPYKFTKNWEQQPETDLSIPGASGALVSTPVDMLRLIEALFENKLISRCSVEQMAKITDGYGMGLLEFGYEQRKALGHNGGIDGYEALLAYFPGDSLAIAYCSNGNTYPTRSVVIGALNIYYNRPYALPDFTIPTIQSKHLKKYTGVYVSTETHVKINITSTKEGLFAQAAGYSSYLLVKVATNVFRSDEASIVIEFTPPKNGMKLRRGDVNYNFEKEN